MSYLYSQPDSQRQTESERCRQMHADHRQTDTVTERGREAGQRQTESERFRQMHADHRQTDTVTERGRPETDRVRTMQTDAC